MLIIHKAYIRPDIQTKDYKVVSQISMPKSARILTVQMQNEDIVMWYQFNQDEEKVTRTFQFCMTGEEMETMHPYIGTVQTKHGYVLHVFEWENYTNG